MDMCTNPPNVADNSSVVARLSRMERAVAALSACLGLDADTLAQQGEEGVEGNAVDRLEAMLVDLADAVRLQTLWVREGERAGFFPVKQSARARLQMEEADIQGLIAQIEQVLQGGPHPDLRAALGQHAATYQERLRGVRGKLALLSYSSPQEEENPP
jgi:hypothetical protein